jgi:hypothetical protein
MPTLEVGTNGMAAPSRLVMSSRRTRVFISGKRRGPCDCPHRVFPLSLDTSNMAEVECQDYAHLLSCYKDISFASAQGSFNPFISIVSLVVADRNQDSQAGLKFSHPMTIIIPTNPYDTRRCGGCTLESDRYSYKWQVHVGGWPAFSKSVSTHRFSWPIIPLSSMESTKPLNIANCSTIL